MTVIEFNPTAPVILVPVRLTGQLGREVVHFVLDTGASRTIVAPDLLDRLGYNPRDGEAFSIVSSVLGRETGYRIRVARLEVFGEAIDDFPVHAHDIADAAGIDGLIGLDVLRRFVCEIDASEEQLRVRRR